MSLLIIAQLSFIFLFKMFKSIEFGGLILDVHRTAGFLILLVIITRLILVPFVKAPKSVSGTPGWQKLSAHIVHFLMIVVLVAQPILGIVLAWYRGDTISFFGLFQIPPMLEYDPVKADQYFGLHTFLGVSLLGLLAIHLGAVVFHAVFQKRNIIERMLPAKSHSDFVNRVPIWFQILAASTLLVGFTVFIGIVSTSKARTAIELQDQAFQQSIAVNSMVQSLGDDLNRSTNMLRNAEESSIISEELGYIEYTLNSIVQKSNSEDVKEAVEQFRSSLVAAQNTLASQDAGVVETSFVALEDALENIKQTQVGAAYYAKSNAVKAAAQGHDLMLAALVPAVLLGVFIAFFLIRSISQYFIEITSFANKISNGVLDECPQVRGQGEAALTFSGLIKMQSDLKVAQQETINVAEIAKLEAKSERESRKKIVDQMILDFENNVFSQIKLLEKAANSVKSQSETVLTSTSHSQKFTSGVTEKVQSSANSVREIAVASDQLSSSIQTVQALVSDASHKAAESANFATDANKVTEELSEISTNIETVVTLISEIAESTNLLALNATIEAARAGEMGKGFSVVATEVKGLANQTSRATADIAEKIHLIKQASNAAVQSVREISVLNSDVDKIAHDVDASLREQIGATADIAGRVDEAAQGAKSIAEQIEQINGIGFEVGATAGAMERSSNEMAKKSKLLDTEARKFIESLRAVS